MKNLSVGILFSIVDGYSREANNIRSQFRGIGGSSEQLAKKVNNSMMAIRTGMLAVTAGASIVAPLVSAVKVSSVFNKEISKVGALARASNTELSAMKDAALDLGKKTEWSAKQAASGMSFLAMAGFSASDTIKAMPGLLDLASAGSLQLARASDIASNILSTFSLKASESNRVADVLARTATRANVNVSQIGESMKFLGPTAASMGVSLEEASAAIGILGDFGLQGSIATSTLSSAMLRFTKPTKAMTETMSRLGIKVFDAQGKFKGLAGMLSEVEKATLGMTDEQKANTLAVLFGSRAYKNIASLLNAQKEVIVDGRKETLKGSAALKGFTKEMMQAAGTAKKVASRQLNNLAGDMTKMASATEGLMISIGDAIEPLLRPVVQFITQLIGKFNVIMDSPIGPFITILAGGFGVLLISLGGLMIATNLYAFANARLALTMKILGNEKVKQAFLDKGLLGGLKALTIHTLKQVKALFTMRNAMIALSTAGVLILIFGIIEAIQSFQNAVNEGKVATSGFARFLQQVGGVIMGVWNAVRSFDGKTFNFGGLEEALKKLGIMETVKGIISWLFRAIEIGRGVVSAFREIFGVIKSMVAPIIKFIKDSFDGFVKSLGIGGLTIRRATSSFAEMRKIGRILGFVVIGILVPAFASFAISVLAATWPILAVIGAVAGVIAIVKNWGSIVNWFTDLFDNFEARLDQGIQKISVWFAQLGVWVQKKLSQLGDWLMKNVPKYLPMALRKAYQLGRVVFVQIPVFITKKMVQLGVWWLRTVVGFIGKAFIMAFRLVRRVFTQAIPWLVNKLREFLWWVATEVPVFLIKGFFKGINFVINLIGNTIPWLVSKFLEFLNWVFFEVPNIIGQAFTNAINWVINIVSQFINWMFVAIPGLLNWIWNSVTQTIPNAFRQAFAYVLELAGRLWETLVGWAEGFKSLGKRLFNALWEGMKSVWRNLTGWASKAFSWFTGGEGGENGGEGTGPGLTNPNARTGSDIDNTILDRNLSLSLANKGKSFSGGTKETITKEQVLQTVKLVVDLDGQTIADQVNQLNQDQFDRSND